jgi:MinD superfamily P-loop ATPase
VKELVVLSGKGGTGKTSLLGALATLAGNKVLVDCDVDAANLYLIADPEIRESHTFIGGQKAEINQQLCAYCGECLDYCRFEAVVSVASDVPDREPRFEIDRLNCEGCGVCTYFCPENAINMKPAESGKWHVSDTRFGPLVHGQLGPGEGNSGKLVTVLRKKARDEAESLKCDLILVDGPPGIGCPAIATLTGAGYVLLVTEPSLSAFHDFKRVAQLVRHFKISAGLCVNKYDINKSISGKIEKNAEENGIDILGRLRYDVDFTRAQVLGRTIMEYSTGETANNIRLLWKKLQKRLQSVDETGMNVNIADIQGL